MLGSGTWWERVESVEPALDSAAKKSFPQRPAFLPPNSVTPTALFNGMITPLMPYAIRGVIWFQGEANESRAFQYRASFSTMIQDWRKQWGEGDFPFYFCQLANFMAKDAAPRESGLAELREAQSMALALPKTGQAITLDLGEEADIHFRNKKTVGQRLARIALAKTYGYPVPYSGPVYDSSRVDGFSIRIRFQHVEDGLKATTIPTAYKRTSTMTTSVPLVRNSPKSQLEGFQICGADHKWVWADAHIDKSTVLVSAPGISKPLAVRYAWGNNPTVNLYNSIDLPAAPFRTDDFEISTQNSHF
jgi:sialate O-acetylesterase